MNKVQLTGRLTDDPDVRYTNGSNQMCVARFRLAVDRRFKREGEPDADFINIVAFGKLGEHAEKYYVRGMKVGVVGRIQTGSYNHKDGYKVYTTEIVAEEMEFEERRNANENGQGGFAPNDSGRNAGFAQPGNNVREQNQQTAQRGFQTQNGGQQGFRQETGSGQPGFRQGQTYRQEGFAEGFMAMTGEEGLPFR